MRPPAGAGDRTARVLQRRQEFVPNERVVASETVPFIRGDGIERIDHMYFDLAVQQAYLASGLVWTCFGCVPGAWCSAEQLFSPKSRDFVRKGINTEAWGIMRGIAAFAFFAKLLPCPGSCISSNAPTEASIRGLLPISKRGSRSMSAAMAPDIPARASPWPCALRLS